MFPQFEDLMSVSRFSPRHQIVGGVYFIVFVVDTWDIGEFLSYAHPHPFQLKIKEKKSYTGWSPKIHFFYTLYLSEEYQHTSEILMRCGNKKRLETLLYYSERPEYLGKTSQRDSSHLYFFPGEISRFLNWLYWLVE